MNTSSESPHELLRRSFSSDECVRSKVLPKRHIPLAPCNSLPSIENIPKGKSGILWVKLPPNSRGNAWKVWSRRFVSIRPNVLFQPETLVNSALIIVHANEREGSREIFKVHLDPTSTLIFRAKSRSQPHTVTIWMSEAPLLHLAGDSESEIQEWMKQLRNILWPPSSLSQLEQMLGSLFEVSIIDNSYTVKANLAGLYGNLLVTSESVMLIDPRTNEIAASWQMSTIGFKLLPQANLVDQDAIVTMIADESATTGYGMVVFYCKQGKQLIERVHQVRQMFSKGKSYGDEVQEALSQLTLLPTRNTYINFENNKRISACVMNKVFGVDCTSSKKSSQRFSWRNISNFSEGMLNSSIVGSAVTRSRNSESECEEVFEETELLAERILQGIKEE